MKTKSLLLLLLMICILISTGYSTEWKGKIGFGIRGPFFAPLFDGSDFMYYDNSYEPYSMGLNISGEIRYGITNNLVANLSVGYASTYDDTTATSDRSFTIVSSKNAASRLEGVLFGLTGSYYFRIDKRTQPFVLAGFGIDYWRVNRRILQTGHSVYDVVDFNLKIGTGVSYWLNDNFTVDGQLRFTYEIANISTDIDPGTYGPGDWSDGSTRPFRGYIEPAIGLTYYFGGGPDSDHDGVSDKKDRCPDTPLGAEVDNHGCPLDYDGDGVFNGLDRCMGTPRGAIVDTTGCPKDSDNDGVFDGIDKCPGTPSNVTVDGFGCPLDTDHDGVPDYQDRCPDTPAGASVDNHGCPLDSDNDGVPDYLDKCPNTPAGATVAENGCPYDADFDGVPDSVDQCLGTPPGVKVDNNGCPIAKRITSKITLSDNVKYASGSFTLSDNAKTVLDGIAESMKAYPDIKIKISGFCDSQGSESYNLILSQNRAEAVMTYLHEKGIPLDRMVARGYGEDPRYFIADNSTPEGRAKNRRVEIETITE